jgi:FkbM family methyltransferase
MMKCSYGIWFPDREIHLVKMLKNSTLVAGKGTYQYHKLTAAMAYVKHQRCALDIGMHVGLWAMHLTKIFQTVIGFEPVAEHLECLHMNMKGSSNYQVHNCALGNKHAFVGLGILEGSTGSTHIKDDIDECIPMRQLDQFSFDAVDFIKIDVEGYEYFTVLGGEQTIRKHKPVIVVEQKPGKVEWYGRKQYDARDLLVSWGARQKFDMNGDCCLSWR